MIRQVGKIFMDDKELKKLLGENIRRIRKSKDLTQETFFWKNRDRALEPIQYWKRKKFAFNTNYHKYTIAIWYYPNEIFDFDIDYVKSAQNLEEEIVNSVKAFDVEKKRVLYKIVKAIEVWT